MRKEMEVGNRKGQVTIFVIIAILIIALSFAIFLFFKKTNVDDINGERIYLYAKNCLEQVSEQAVLEIGEQGGYSSLNASIYSFPYIVPVYMNKGEKKIPTKEIIEKEISLYISNYVPECFGNFSEFVNEGFSIKTGEIKTTTTIKEDSVKINSDIPLTVSKGESSVIFRSFSTIIKPVRIPKMLEISEIIVDRQIDYSKAICLSCLVLNEENDISLKIFETDNNNEFVYVISDNSSFISGVAYNFSFGIRYDFPICNTNKGCFNELS